MRFELKRRVGCISVTDVCCLVHALQAPEKKERPTPVEAPVLVKRGPAEAASAMTSRQPELTVREFMAQPDFFKLLALSVTNHLRSEQVCHLLQYQVLRV
jgi:hypothetical protein